MADLSSCPYVHSKDQERIIDLLLAYRLATSIYTYPTIWRSLLLLTSRVGEPAYDTCLWEDTAGRVVGLAMLWRRYPKDPYLVLERFVHPDFVTDDLVEALSAWGIQRAHQVAATQAIPLTLYTNRIGPAIHPDRPLEVYGFKPMTPDPQEYNIYFTRSLQATLPAPILPVGYTLRSLQGVAELEKYNTLYGFATVNLQHRQELLTSDEYSHLIVEDSSGTFVAFCECSICRAEW